MKTYEGRKSAKGLKLGIVVSQYHDVVAKRLLDGTREAVLKNEGDEKNIRIVYVPGSWEIPLMAQKLASSGEVDAVVCLGAVIRGETDHYEYICQQTSEALAQIQLRTEVPVAFGVLTCDTLEQAMERSGGKAGNKGYDAAMAAMQMVSLLKQLE